MQSRPDPQRWAAAWLAGIARAVQAGRMAPAAVKTAEQRARMCGLTPDDIAAILKRVIREEPTSTSTVSPGTT